MTRKSMHTIVKGILDALDHTLYKSARAIAVEVGTNTETATRYLELITMIQGEHDIKVETTDQGRVYKRGP